MWLARVRFLFRGNTCCRHFQSPIFCIRDDLWSVVGEAILLPTRNGQFSLPVAFVAEIEEGRQLRRIMVNSAKAEMSFAKEVRCLPTGLMPWR